MGWRKHRHQGEKGHEDRRHTIVEKFQRDIESSRGGKSKEGKRKEGKEPQERDSGGSCDLDMSLVFLW